MEPLLELNVLILNLLRNSADILEPSALNIIERVSRSARSTPLRDQPVLNGNQLVFRASLCGVLALTGERDQIHESMVQRAIDAGHLLGQSE